MYQKILHTANAKKLPLPLDAWILYHFENHEIIRLLVIKTTESG